MKKIINRVLTLVAVFATSVGVCGCYVTSGPPTDTLGLSVRKTSSDASGGSTFVYVVSSSYWTLSLEPADCSWARLSRTEGSSSSGDIVFTWDANTDTLSRSVKIVLIGETAYLSETFTQEGTIKEDTPSEPASKVLEADPVSPWLELPATNDTNLYFFTHPMTLGGKTCRNYSYYYDPQALVAHWVAYPLNSGLLAGSGGRSNDWGLDPKVPEQYQAVLYSAYSNSGQYARGHQIPSADRKTYEYNAQTFYGVNMTPQLHTFNEGIWGGLEAYVRSMCTKVDTLYVVTGCTVKGSTEYSYDNRGKKVTIPTAYYKALLGYSSKKSVGITPTTAGYTAIGFYFVHEPNSGDYKNYAITIDELEEKVGVDFFVNLQEKIGTTLYNKVESTMDNWWMQ